MSEENKELPDSSSDTASRVGAAGREAAGGPHGRPAEQGPGSERGQDARDTELPRVQAGRGADEGRGQDARDTGTRRGGATRPGGREAVWPLYGAAFATGVSLSVAWTAMPFVLSAMRGTEVHVGYAPAVNCFAYMCALLITGTRLGHLDVRRATRTAAVVAWLSAMLMVGSVLGSVWYAGGGLAWVWMMIAAGGLGGAAMALFWPFLMSWVSGTREGVALNRRLGRYNGSWSSGGVVGPLIGAWLAGKNPLWPMAASAGCFVVTFVLLGLARREAGSSAARLPEHEETPDGVSTSLDARTLADFRWMSRIALFCAWASFAVLRSQYALVFTGPVGGTEGQFGAFMTTLALCNFLTLIASGRWAFWHFRAGLLFIAQAMILVALLTVTYGRTLAVLFLSPVILGLAFGFAYSSHLFYGTSASRKRSVRMVIHEVVISLGITIGSGTGGYLAKHVGLYAPYWFAIALVAFGFAVQMAIHLVSQAGLSSRRSAAATQSVEIVE
jgi:MFS family permease